MPRSLSDVQSFMDRERLAGFVTLGPRNEPHVVPVFFTYENGKVYIQTDRNSAKVRNLSRRNNVAVAVYSGEEAVIIKGKGRIIDNAEEFTRKTQEHINKYKLKIDQNGRDSLGIPLFDEKVRCIVEVSPKRIIFW